MNTITPIGLFAFISLFTLACASNYKTINPNIQNYTSKSTNLQNDIVLEYKYDLLYKKYKRKESKYGLKIIAVKITNLSDKDLRFGNELSLTYDNGSAINLLETEEIYSELKQVSIGYFLYFLLTPLKLTFSKTNSVTGAIDSNSIPIGYVVGPGLAARNLIVAHTANRQFKAELSKYNLKNTLVKKGVSTYGLVGIRAKNFDALKLASN